MPESPPTITRDDVAKLANLARIDLTDAELDRLAPQLAVILESVAAVSGVAADDIPPSSHALPMENVMRPDEVRASLTPEEALVRRTGAGAAAVQGAADPGGGAVSDLTRMAAAELADGHLVRRDQLGRGRRGPISTASRRSTPRCTRSWSWTPRARWPRRRRPTTAPRQSAPGGADLPELLGVPIAVKDIATTKGLTTTAGSRILEGWVPPYDATLVARLRASRSADPGQDQHGRVRHGQLDRALRATARPTTPGTSSASRAARAVARRRPSRGSPPRSPSAPTPAARSGSPAR